MPTTVGLSLCHTTRGRITVVTVITAITMTVMLTYNITPLLTSVRTESEAHYLKDGQVRESTLGLQITSTKNLVSPIKCTAMKRFPDALIIGVKKGGTRALISMLKSHPSIVTATSEVHYFDRDVNFSKGVQWYINQMPYSLSQQITIEKSPSYFVSGPAASRVYTLSPNQKIILIVRNPIDRTLSDFTQLDYKKGKQGGHWSFEGKIFLSPSGEVNTAFSPISVSMYDVHFEAWLKYFSIDQILVVDGDKLIQEPLTELKRVEKFLEVKQYFTSDKFYYNSTKGFHCWKKTDKKGRVVPVCLGSAKGRQHPKLSNLTEQRLASFFAPHNNRFYEQVQHKFNWDK